jgi:hypothetical protein
MHEERQWTGFDPIAFAALQILRAECALHRSLAIVRRGNRVGEPVSAGVFVVVQIAHGALAFRAGIERLNHHRGYRSGSGDLDPRQRKRRRQSRYLPRLGGGLAGGNDAGGVLFCSAWRNRSARAARTVAI